MSRCVVTQRDKDSEGDLDALWLSCHFSLQFAVRAAKLQRGRRRRVPGPLAVRGAAGGAADGQPCRPFAGRVTRGPGHPTKPPPPTERSPGVAFGAETKETSYKPPVSNFIWENEILGFSQTVTVLLGCNLVRVAGFSAHGCLIKSVS